MQEGPSSFAVFKDGWLDINDPLNHRIVLYDSLGIYKSKQKVDFSVIRLWLNEDEDLFLEKATTGDTIKIYHAGEVQPISLHERNEAKQAKAKFLDFNRGEIALPKIKARGIQSIKVYFRSDSLKMMSLSPLALDKYGDTFVLIEVLRARAIVDISQIIRKYAANGDLISQIDDVPMDYYVYPLDKFYFNKGRIYQLLPKKDEIVINIWNTN